MFGQTIQRRMHLVETHAAAQAAAFAQAVAEGLTSSPKRLPFQYLYDAEGARLFQQICDQPEYDLPRVEAAILTDRAEEIVELTPTSASLVELGCGDAHKTRILLDAFFARQWRLRYMPIDIARSTLERTSVALLEAYPRLDIVAIAADYDAGMREASLRDHPQLVLWLGSNIGNFSRTEAAAFLGGVHAAMEFGDRMLIGVDMCRDAEAVERAYNDRRGVTAAFNKNILARINRELGGDFDLESFRHRALYEEDEDRVEMSLVSTEAQTVRIDRLDLEVALHEGEAIHTEYSYKYSQRELEVLAHAACFDLTRLWLDPAQRYGLSLLTPRGR